MKSSTTHAHTRTHTVAYAKMQSRAVRYPRRRAVVEPGRSNEICGPLQTHVHMSGAKEGEGAMPPICGLASPLPPPIWVLRKRENKDSFPIKL